MECTDMTTTLDPQFLRAVILITGFKPNRMRQTQAALLLIGCHCENFTACDIPRDITNGDRHLAGAAVGSMIAAGLLKVVGRVKSPDRSANGRKLDVLQIVNIEKAKAWLKANEFNAPQEQAKMQML